MTTPVAHSSSGSSRLLLGAPGFAVGWQEPVYLPNPAAGAGFKYKVDGRYFERVIAVSFTYTASAVVANRFPQLQLLDGNGKIITAIIAGNGIVANGVAQVYLAINNPQTAGGASGGVFGFLPDFLIPADWSWSLFTFGADAGDQLSSIVLLTQRYPNDAAIQPTGM